MYLHNNVEPEPESRDNLEVIEENVKKSPINRPETLADRVGAELSKKEGKKEKSYVTPVKTQAKKLNKKEYKETRTS